MNHTKQSSYPVHDCDIRPTVATKKTAVSGCVLAFMLVQLSFALQPLLFTLVIVLNFEHYRQRHTEVRWRPGKKQVRCPHVRT